jgi:hypothetical protein
MSEEIDILEMQTESLEEPPPSAPDGFEVRDAASANWLVRKVNDARTYRSSVKAWAEAETRRSEREEQFFMERYGRQLETWAREQIDKGRRKSVPLPAGVVGFRSEPLRLNVFDEPKIIAWCRHSLPDAIRVQTFIIKSSIRDYVDKTGECPDGAEVCGGGQRFYVSEARRR